MPFTTKLSKDVKIGGIDLWRVSLLMSNNCGMGLEFTPTPISEYLDYFFIHGYQITEIAHDHYPQTFEGNIKCDTVVIDLMGEYVGLADLKTYYEFFETHFQYNNVIVIGCYHSNDKIRFRNWRFFKDDFPNMFFVHPQNDTFNLWNISGTPQVIMGTNMVDKKEHLFMCLNNGMRDHRCSMVHSILKRGLEKDNLLTSRSQQWNKINIPEIQIDNPLGGQEDKGTSRWNLQPEFSNKSYIDVITETKYHHPFYTEKPLKTFMSLQFPLILGYKDSVKYYRDKGFDMFDDIIDHSYDGIVDLEEKTEKIADELLRLSSLDFHKIYSESKDRLLHNQQLLNEYRMKNKRIENIVKFIFTDSFEVFSSKNYNTLYL